MARIHLNQGELVDNFHLCPTPPSEPRTIVLVRLKAGDSLTCRILSKQIWGIWTHWDGKKSYPCVLGAGACKGCRTQDPKRWKGFLHVLNVANRREMIIEVTAFAFSQFLDQLTKERENLRGLRVLFERAKGSDNGRLRMSLLASETGFLELPVESAPSWTLMKLWKIPPHVDNAN